MNKLGRTFTVLLAVMLAGCVSAGDADPGGGTNYSSSNRAALVSQTDDYRRTIGEGALFGAALGGIGAAVITAAAGGDSKDVVRNGLIAAGIGAGVGAVVGKNVADTKQDYARREDELGAVIARARNNNAKLASMVGTARALVAERRRQAASLSGAAARQSLKRALSSDRAALGEAVASSQKEVSHLQDLKRRLRGNAALENEIGKARSRNNELVDAREEIQTIEEVVK